MPIYEYVCGKCGHAFEHLARTTRDVARKCPACGAARPARQFSAFSARVADSAGKSCERCPATSSCPSAGHGCHAAADGCR